MRVLLACVVGAGMGCVKPSEENPIPNQTQYTGIVQYEKKGVDSNAETTIVPIAGAPVLLVDLQTDTVLAENWTDANGQYTIILPKERSSNTALRLIARYSGPAIDAGVFKDADGSILWTTQWDPETGPNFTITDAYEAGAFNIHAMVRQVDELMYELVPEKTPPFLTIRWLREDQLPCISCYYTDTYTLDLTGVVGDEDGHDDSVILHELGHYIEDAWGVYDNPGGPHDREHVTPLLAWSEGFSTWFQAALRGQADYIDNAPNGQYVLDLENPPEEALGLQGVLPEALVSEALVYAVLWDLTDDSPDEETLHYPIEDVARIIVGLTHDHDVGVSGADFLDFLNDWRCSHPTPEDDANLQLILESVDFPMDITVAPVCLTESTTP